MSFVWGVLGVAIIVALYLVVAYLNQKTDVPKGCQEAYDEAQNCTACGLKNNCGIRKAIIEMKETKL